MSKLRKLYMEKVQFYQASNESVKAKMAPNIDPNKFSEFTNLTRYSVEDIKKLLRTFQNVKQTIFNIEHTMLWKKYRNYYSERTM